MLSHFGRCYIIAFFRDIVASFIATTPVLSHPKMNVIASSRNLQWPIWSDLKLDSKKRLCTGVVLCTTNKLVHPYLWLNASNAPYMLFSGGVWPIYIKQHGRISKITILLKRHFILCTRMLCSSYQSKINTVNTKTRITRITMIWNVYKLTIMTSPPFKGKFIKHAM